jgi:hypothetical protein
VKPKVVLAVIGMVLLAGVAFLLLRDSPSFAERVKASDTCAELDEVAADGRDPNVPEDDPDALLRALDDPESARSQELRDGIVDSVLVVTRARELGC